MIVTDLRERIAECSPRISPMNIPAYRRLYKARDAVLAFLTAPLPWSWAEYDSAAEWCAKRGLSGATGTPLPSMLSQAVLREINYDPDAFARRVRECAYQRAGEKTARPDPINESPSYRSALKDAGRGHLVR